MNSTDFTVWKNEKFLSLPQKIFREKIIVQNNLKSGIHIHVRYITRKFEKTSDDPKITNLRAQIDTKQAMNANSTQ